MKIKLTIPVLSAVMIILASCGSGSSGGSGQPIGHDNLNAADIPQSVLDGIRTMDVYFEHASVGHNIMEGLITLAGTNATRYRFEHFALDDTTLDNETDNIGSVIPAWFVTYNSFGDNARGNPGFDAKVSGFDRRLRSSDFAAALDVAMFKFCFVDKEGLDDPQSRFDSVRITMEDLETDYPGTTFVWFTMPIETTADANRAAFNELVRDYCAAHDQWLLDIADIESHDAAGTHRTDDDGHELMVEDWSSDGGHLNAAGGERVARAWWVLLAKIRGW